MYNNVQTSTQIQTHFQAGRTFPDQALSVFSIRRRQWAIKGTTLVLCSFFAGWFVWYRVDPARLRFMQQTTPHEFSLRTDGWPLTQVTLVDRIDFIDKSTIPVSGYVEVNNTDCFQKEFEILVNGVSFSPPVYTDPIGKFVIDLDPGFSGTLTIQIFDHVFFPPVHEVINVVNPIAELYFVESRKISGKVVGVMNNAISFKIRSTPQGTLLHC